MQIETEYGFNKLIIHPQFNSIIREINKLKIKIPQTPSSENLFLNLMPFRGGVLSPIEDIGSYKLNPKNGENLSHGKRTITAYDESFQKYTAIEGTVYITAHSLILHHEDDYLNSSYLTMYFFTKSNLIKKNAKNIVRVDDPDIENNRRYAKDRNELILNNTPNNSIIFIDGPLIGGQISEYTTKLNDELLKKNIVPIFIVKNSRSSMVTDNIKEFSGEYNSDLHWANTILKPGERTNLFRYQDKHKKSNSKIFFYIKAFGDTSPQRVEFHENTLKKYGKELLDIFDIVYYLMLAQGDPHNPQLRSIYIAEKYARAVVNLIDINKLMKSAGLISTINQERFGRS